jgi:HlyD family secretion protein
VVREFRFRAAALPLVRRGFTFRRHPALNPIPALPAKDVAAASSALPVKDLAAAIQSGGAGKHFKRNLILGLLLLAGAGGGWFWWSRSQRIAHQLPAFVTETLQRGEIHLIITATGTLEPTNEVTVGSELSGITLEVNADINDRVGKGQPLAKLDTSRLTQQTESSRANVRAAQAKVEQSQATVRESAANLSRQLNLRRLSKGMATSKSDLDMATASADRAGADLLNAEAEVGTAQAQVKINENDLTKAVIKSPIEGVVLTRNLEPGQTVVASFTAPQLFIIAESLEKMKLNVAIAEADIGRVAKGQDSTFTVDAWPDRSYTAKVSRVAYGSEVKDNVVTYLAELEVSNVDLSLRPGMTATADIAVADATDIFVVPAAALRFTPANPAAVSTAKKSLLQNIIPMPGRGSKRPSLEEAGEPSSAGHRVWVLRDGRPVAIAVTVGLSDGRHTGVTGPGLAEGLEIIIRANSPVP